MGAACFDRVAVRHPRWVNVQSVVSRIPPSRLASPRMATAQMMSTSSPIMSAYHAG